MTVSLLEILAAARAHAAPLAAESAGYLLLAVADHVVSAPRVARAEDVELMPDGSVRLRARRSSVSVGADENVEHAARALLKRTLEVASSVGPALRRAAERRDDVGVASLVRELEAALIPVNRSAAKRALSRLHRETERARDSGKLDALLRDEPESAPLPVVAPPVVARVAAPLAMPVAAPKPPVVEALVAEPIALAAEFPEPSPSLTPAMVAPAVAPAPSRLAPAREAASAVVVPDLTPEPLIATAEPAFTKPEPVVQRAKERGSSTPRLGTVVTAQTMPGEEGERTERAPAVALESEAELEIDIEVELEAPLVVAVVAPQPLVDPEPSCMPDVLSAMRELHTGVDADDAPTRIRDVVTELRPLTPEPAEVDDAWLTPSSLEGVVSAPTIFVSEQVDATVHDALTWNPGPVVTSVASPLSKALLIAEPLPEPSPYAPAVLPARSSDVSELLDSFYVSGGTEERELRSALKEMAGLELTPMPHPLIEER